MIEHSVLISTLSYDPSTGVFTWLKQLNSRGIIGSVAGCKSKAGYWVITINKVQYLAHRLAWFYAHKSWPGTLDHRDEDKTNNRISNLREVTTEQNAQNVTPAHRDSKSGFRGVSKCKQTGRWLAQITANKQHHHLGRFDSPEEASQAYQKARAELHIRKEN